jgi:hypothetical protein
MSGAENGDEWAALASVAERPKVDALKLYTRLGLSPILVNGIRSDGRCTCGALSCGAIGKHPLWAGWQRGEVDLARMECALGKEPSVNIGLRMGPQPNGRVLICLDVDGPRDLLAPLEQQFGALPETLTAHSGRGIHLVYALPPGVAPPRNRVGVAKRIDLRSEGGQIVVAPSKHATGRIYEWVLARAPEVLP